MNTKEELLKILLNHQDYISGSEIASILGVSRNAIWKAVVKLAEEGIKIDSKQNMGYKLVDYVPFVNKEVINHYLDDKFYDISVFDSITSTSTYLKSKNEEFSEGKVVFAREQTSGRGRLNRKFYSPKDAGLYFSILVKPKIKVENSIYLTVLSAVSVYEAIFEELNIDLGIKWVNDLYLNDKKVCGILSEGAIKIEANSLDYCVIGIGINLFKPKNGLNEEIKDIATFILDRPYDLNKVASTILKKFKIHYLDYLNGNYSFINTYKLHQLLIGKTVEVCNLYNDEKYKALVLKVNDDCSLLVEAEGKQVNLNSGEVRIIVNK
ncbi:MAG: biotin--[acetyl-CoA-carboxylase] ligase [Bacilli bacterium]|nr:biotin--[acetyl-CoA-carboxylase] ligase [Bacilli bacterium]